MNFLTFFIRVRRGDEFLSLWRRRSTLRNEAAERMVDEFEDNYPRDMFPGNYLVVFGHRNDLVLVRGLDGVLEVLR